MNSEINEAQNEISELSKLKEQKEEPHKVNNEVSNSFKKKVEKLDIEENKLKEKLENEVSKIITYFFINLFN